MALRGNRRWTARVDEVKRLLRHLRHVRVGEREPAPSGHRSAAEREAETILAALKRAARSLIAEAGGLSPRRVQFDPDLGKPAILRTAEDEKHGGLRWRMAFGPAALSSSGPARTRKLVDGLRGELALERAAFHARVAAVGSPPILD